MIVVSDTGPINYLVQIDVVGVLPELFGSVILPVGVVFELRAAGAPTKVRSWAEELPNWVIVRGAEDFPSPKLPRLGLGETEAITIALGLRADLILLDDGAARKASGEAAPGGDRYAGCSAGCSRRRIAGLSRVRCSDQEGRLSND